MRRLVLALLLALFAATAQAQTATITGKLIDRQCSIEDVYQLQPLSERRCTLWIESSWSCPLPSGEPRTCKSVFTVYCPNAAVDNRPMNSAYWTCADPSTLQIRHPTKTYTISAYLRTVAQQSDGFGQFLGFGFQY